MSVLKKFLAGAAALSLTAVPVAANAADASKLSVASHARAGTSTAKEDKFAGGGVIVAVLAAAAVVAGIIIIADSDDDSDSDG